MGATISVIKTLFIPAVISLIIFLLTTYVLFPLWQRHRIRYSNYLPLETLTGRTSSLRARVQDGLARWAVPLAWRSRLQDRIVVAGGPDDPRGSSDADYDSEEGEELGDVLGPAALRGLELGGGGGGGGIAQDAPDATRRLSRELEQGFRDDSDNEVDTYRAATSRTGRRSQR